MEAIERRIMGNKKCDVCNDAELLINSPYDICEKCADELKAAIKLPPIGIINSDGEVIRDS